MNCPTSDSLLSYLLGELEHDGRDSLEAHLEDCPDCLSRLECLAAEGGPLKEPSLSAAGTRGAEEDTPVWGAVRDRLASHVRAAAQQPPSAATLISPVSIDGYELLEEIGRGGMGVVYRARQFALNRIVAVKTIAWHDLGRPSLRHRFRVEAESAARLDHRGIVPIYNIGEAGPYVYYSMAFVAGGTLADKLEQPWAARDAALLVRDVARAVEYAHQRGVIHRDLKPSNILLELDGSPKVADFGLAKQIDSGAQATATGEVLGTPAYMPPEQAGGRVRDVTACSDVYSLGGILYCLVTGRPPFADGDLVGVLHKVIHEDPAPPRQLNPELHQDLDVVIRKCLAKEQRDRYSTAGKLADELDRFLNGKPIEARPIGPLGRLTRWSRRYPALAMLSASLGLVLIAATIVSSYLGIIANHRSARLTTANDKLTESEREARSFADAARREAEHAQAQADATIRIMETMLFDMQNVVSYDPAEQERRRNLLTSVMQELEGVEPDERTRRRLLRCRAAAILGLADVVMQAGEIDGGTGLTGARSYYLQAIELFEQLDNEYQDALTGTEYSDALMEYGDTLAEAGRWKLANELFQRALPIRMKLIEQDPDNLKMQAELAELEILAGEGLNYTGQPKAALDLLEQARNRCAEVLEKDPQYRFARGEYFHACLELGDWFMQYKDVSAATERFREAAEVAAQTARDHPVDVNCKMDLSTAHERLGDVATSAGDLEGGYAEYRESLRICQLVEVAAPNNDHVKWQVSFGYQKVATSALGIKDYSAAFEASLACLKMRNDLAIGDVENLHLHRKILHAARLLADAAQKPDDNLRAQPEWRRALQRIDTFSAVTGSDQFSTNAAWLRELVGDDQTASSKP